jgi:hypothetical protein
MMEPHNILREARIPKLVQVTSSKSFQDDVQYPSKLQNDYWKEYL